MSHASIEDLARDKARWEILADLIRSEQVPEDRLAEIAKEFPDFWKWLQAGKGE